MIYIFLGSVVIILIHLFLLIKRRDEVRKLRMYVKAINDKNYNLDIDDNCEDELSKLKNELYKIAVSLKESAETSNKEKEQLSNSITDISHQLKTPLTSIRIMIDNIQDNPSMDDETKNEFIKEISNQIEWINSLVISLLKAARFDANAVKLNRVTISVNELVNNVINNLSILLDIRNVKVNLKIDEDATLIGDYKWELEALTNIVKNAVEHSMDDGLIDIRVEDNSLFLKLIIKDNGEGIEKSELSHIFERFYRSKNSGENNVGVGLSLAKAIIEKDNGYINVKSEAGVGTTFEIKYMK